MMPVTYLNPTAQSGLTRYPRWCRERCWEGRVVGVRGVKLPCGDQDPEDHNVEQDEDHEEGDVDPGDHLGSCDETGAGLPTSALFDLLLAFTGKYQRDDGRNDRAYHPRDDGENERDDRIRVRLWHRRWCTCPVAGRLRELVGRWLIDRRTVGLAESAGLWGGRGLHRWLVGR